MQPGRDLDFLEEPASTQGGCHRGANQLDCDIASVLLVAGQQHHRHPATTELAHDPVALAEQLRDFQRILSE